MCSSIVIDQVRWWCGAVSQFVETSTRGIQSGYHPHGTVEGREVGFTGLSGRGSRRSRGHNRLRDSRLLRLKSDQLPDAEPQQQGPQQARQHHRGRKIPDGAGSLGSTTGSTGLMIRHRTIHHILRFRRGRFPEELVRKPLGHDAHGTHGAPLRDRRCGVGYSTKSSPPTIGAIATHCQRRTASWGQCSSSRQVRRFRVHCHC